PGSSLVRKRNRYAKCVLIRVPRRNARRSAPFGAHKLTPVSVRTSRISAAGRPTASPRAQPVGRSATGFRESTVASRSTMTSAWGNCSKAWSESVRSLAMSPQYRRAYAGLQLLQPALEPQASGTEHVLVQAHVANGLSAEPRLEPVEPEPGMIRSRLLRDAPPVIGVAAECPKIEHRLPVQQIVGHQLALALGGAPEQVVGRLAEAKDHDAGQQVTLVLRQVEPDLVAPAEQVEGGLVIGGTRQVNPLPFRRLAGEAGEYCHIS